MTNDNEFERIRPYDEDEARLAFERLAKNPTLPLISKYLFPNEDPLKLTRTLKKIHTIQEFQDTVMLDMISSILGMTSEGFTFEGLENIRALDGKKFLAVSNHRDIVLDPALIQYALRSAGFQYTEICVGSNLLSSKWIEDLMRINGMVTVIRGISARELYLSSQILSKYIRKTVSSGTSSIWIAQREGRTKNGIDTTEQGLLKMFDLSGDKGFVENFKELNIVPMSISYEYESCDARKARELLVKREQGSYKKRPNEDLHSIMTGIRQQKGHIHLSIGKPLTPEEIEKAGEWKGNDRYQAIRSLLDERIIRGYRLYKTNYIAADILEGSTRYQGIKYLPEDRTAFEKYAEHKMSKIEKRLQGDALREIFYGIYGNPVKTAGER